MPNERIKASRVMTLLTVTLVFGMVACTSEETPTEPGTAGNPAPAAPSFALASNTWTARAPSPGPAWGSFAGVITSAAGQSVVYRFGGTFGQGGTGVYTSAYDVTTNIWTDKGSSSSTFVFNSNGVGRIGSKFYFSGGYTFIAGDKEAVPFVWAYDPGGNRLIRKADMPKYTAEGVTGVIDGKLYVLPGICSTDFWPSPGYCEHQPNRQLYRYDPATNSWVTRRSPPHFHRGAAAGVINGKFYVAGGVGEGGFNNAALDVYDPATNTWSTLAPLPVAGRAIGAVLGGKLFAIVGGSPGVPGPGSVLHAYAYYPASNTWKSKAAPNFVHDALVRVTLDGLPYLLAVGGPFYSDSTNDSELYRP